MSMGDS